MASGWRRGVGVAEPGWGGGGSVLGEVEEGKLGGCRTGGG